MMDSTRSVSTSLLGANGGESEIEVATTRAHEAVRRALARIPTTSTITTTEAKTADPSRFNWPLDLANSADTSLLVSFPPPRVPEPPRTATFHALQEWEGHVVELGDDEFVARLVDITAGRSHESEEAVIPMVEVSECDASRMVVGSIFRWVIGYERSVEGTRKRVSQIVFRDLPRTTMCDLQRGRSWARKIAPTLNP